MRVLLLTQHHNVKKIISCCDEKINRCNGNICVCVQFLLQPDDGNSDASGESTACDSGRGGSEEDSHSLGRSSPPVSAGNYHGHLTWHHILSGILRLVTKMIIFLKFYFCQSGLLMFGISLIATIEGEGEGEGDIGIKCLFLTYVDIFPTS